MFASKQIVLNGSELRSDIYDCERYKDGSCADEITSENLKWYAVQTHSCREKIAARSLREQGIRSCLPLLTERRRWSDRIKTIEAPLFCGYVFVRIDVQREEFWNVCYTRGVSRILGDINGPISIPDEQITGIVKLAESKRQLQVVCDFVKGQTVRIKSGSLAGIEGQFVRQEGRDCLAIHIDILGQTILVVVNSCDVQKDGMIYTAPAAE